MSEPTHVWMQHTITGGKALFPVGAVALWEPQGWKVIDDGAPVPVAPAPAASYPTPIYEAAAEVRAAVAPPQAEPQAESAAGAPEPAPAKGTKSTPITKTQE